MQTIQKGEIGYVKEISVRPNSQLKSAIGKGHHYIIMALGVLPKDMPVPETNIVHQLLGECGLVKFDDIGEFLGEDAMKAVMAKFEEKYK